MQGPARPLHARAPRAQLRRTRAALALGAASQGLLLRKVLHGVLGVGLDGGAALGPVGRADLQGGGHAAQGGVSRRAQLAVCSRRLVAALRAQAASAAQTPPPSSPSPPAPTHLAVLVGELEGLEQAQRLVHCGSRAAWCEQVAG